MNPVALAHDVLAARAGGERVLLALADAFPTAPIHTLVHQPETTFEEFEGRPIETTWLQDLRWLRTRYRQALPVAALTYAAREIHAEVTVCSTSGLSHHVRTTGAKIVYCHTPARWLHDSSSYLDGYSTAVRLAARSAAPGFRRLDRWAMHSADQVVTNSSHVATEIESTYGLHATVVPPCSTLAVDGPVAPLPGVAPGFVLSPARPLGYKRLDVLLEAARGLPDRQVVHIGDGPHRQALLREAPRNFVSFGGVSDAQLRWAYRNAQVVALTCAEDYGLVPLEASAHGVHTIAPAARGMLDHDPSMLTMYPFTSVHDLIDAIGRAPDPTGRLDTTRLGREQFIAAMRAIVIAHR